MKSSGMATGHIESPPPAWQSNAAQDIPVAVNATVDKYFLAGMGHLVSQGAPTAERPIEQLGPNAFVYEEVAVVVRYITPAELQALHRRRIRKLYYVIDDDMHALVRDPHQPLSYRWRIWRFMRGPQKQLRKWPLAIVAPSRVILDRWDVEEKHLLHPVMLAPPPGTAHFADMSTIRAIFMGSRSHLHDLKAILPGLLRWLDETPHARLDVFLGRHCPRSLRKHPSVRNRDPVPWPRFRAFLQQQRYHLALAPMLDTPVNHARSINKLLDCAAVGACGVFSRGCYELHDAITHRKNAFLLGTEASCWAGFLKGLVGDGAAMAAISGKGQELASKLGRQDNFSRFWQTAFDLQEKSRG